MTFEEKARVVAGLTELVGPGSMLRFVYSRDGDRVLMSIEGAVDNGSSRLRDQLKIALEMLRIEGLLFSQGGVNFEPSRKTERVITVRPKTRILSLSSGQSLGFHTSSLDSPSVCKLTLPDIAPVWKLRWLSFAPLLLLEDDRFNSAEVEFRARYLTSQELKTVEAIYNDRLQKLQLLALAEKAPLPPLERFLNLWLQNERGWSVKCRVAVKLDGKIPEAVSEIFASEVLGVPCEIQSSSKPAPDTLTLGDAFPAGWNFPSLLPGSTDFLRLSAPKVVNRQLPILPKKGLTLGRIERCELRMPLEMRDRHTYIVGATGTGKSTLLLNLIEQDLAAGRGVALLDPHGDLCDAVLDKLPKNRIEDTFYFDLADGKFTPGFNLLELSDGPHRTLERNLVVNELFSVFEQLYDTTCGSAAGRCSRCIFEMPCCY